MQDLQTPVLKNFLSGGVMLVVGLTGGIGCGKSEVRRRLLQAGLRVIDADTLAKEIAEKNSAVVATIKKEFGDDIYDADGRLRRKALAAIVFNDSERLATLNAIIHPRVIGTVEREIDALRERGEKIVVVEAALHYEVNWYEAMDVMVVVSAPMDQRLRRIMQRDGVDEAAVHRRIATQLPIEEKVKRADFVIENDGDLETLDDKVEKLLQWLHAKAVA
jgi:dephospho-CoA kinase